MGLDESPAAVVFNAPRDSVGSREAQKARSFPVLLCPFSVISWVTGVGVPSPSQEDEALIDHLSGPHKGCLSLSPQWQGHEHQPLVPDPNTSPSSAACSLWNLQKFPPHSASVVVQMQINESVRGADSSART